MERGGPVPGSRKGAVGYPVLIVDDHELFSSTLMIALRERGIEARKMPVARLSQFLAQLSDGNVGLVVLDLNLGRDSAGKRIMGSDLVEGVRARGWDVLMVSGSEDEPGLDAAIARGALGSVPKSSAFDSLLKTVLLAAAGEPVMAADERQRRTLAYRRHFAEQEDLRRRFDRLSVRELEVLELLADGLRAAAIAKRFVVAMATVRTQIRSILAKLEVTSQLEAVALFKQRPKG